MTLTHNRLNEIFEKAKLADLKNNPFDDSGQIFLQSCAPIVIQEMVARLMEAEKVIGFYADTDKKYDSFVRDNDEYIKAYADEDDISQGHFGKRARAYQEKWGLK